MQMGKKVQILPATKNTQIPNSVSTFTKRRVAAYARVSTDFDEQLTSFQAQRDYYTKFIKEKSEWEFVDVYADEGISGTSLKFRDGFNRMVNDAIAGKIDLIITKSVSRFARNTVDTLITVRRLKEKNVEVYFEKENIYTMDSKGELLLTIMSSLAQQESKNISENVTWGQRKRFADGKVSLPYGQFLGYEKGENSVPKIVEKEAVVVRKIYRHFLEGKTPSGIAKLLTEKNIKTPSGKDKWAVSTVKSILQNEKYKGDALLQKSYTVDFLTKKKKINEGEIPQYYVENSHPAIIEPETFELVQAEFKRRESAGKYTSAINCFGSRIVCGDCGGFYGRKVWHSNTKYTQIIWQCNHKFRNKTCCSTPHLKEEVLKLAFVEVINSLIENREEIIKVYDELTLRMTDFTKENEEVNRLELESKIIYKTIENLIYENARIMMDQMEYTKQYNALSEKHNKHQNRINALTTEIDLKKAKRSMMNDFLITLSKQEKLLTAFDENLWSATLSHVIVKSDTELLFHFKDGRILPFQIEIKEC